MKSSIRFAIIINDNIDFIRISSKLEPRMEPNKWTRRSLLSQNDSQ